MTEPTGTPGRPPSRRAAGAPVPGPPPSAPSAAGSTTGGPAAPEPASPAPSSTALAPSAQPVEPAGAPEAAKSPAGAPQDAPSDADEATSGRRRVVVAEDEAIIRMDVVEMLQEAGYEVVGEAADGEEAVRLAEEHRPDLVVMDVKMPVLDGISAAERIAKQRVAPVVMLTAFSQRELVERARDAGAMAYVVKPFTAADLLPAVEIAASRYAEISALEREVADLSERFETRKRVERAKGVLMTRMGLSEPQAFRWIQKTSMDRRLTMRQVADAVIEGIPK